VVLSACSRLNPSVAPTIHDDARTFECEREVDPTKDDLLIGYFQTDSNWSFLGEFATSSLDERRPSVSTTMKGSNRQLVAFERRHGGDCDVLGC